MSAQEAATARPGRAPVRVTVPGHLQTLARVNSEVVVEVGEPFTVEAVIDAIEDAHPALHGTLRDRDTGRRRAMIRTYAAGEDYSDLWTDAELPASVLEGREPLRLVGSIAGG